MTRFTFWLVLNFYKLVRWRCVIFAVWQFPFCFFANRKQRKKLRDRLRQSSKNKRKNNTSSGTSTGTDSNLEASAAGQQNSNVPLQDLKFVNVSCWYQVKVIKTWICRDITTYLRIFFSHVMAQQCSRQLRRQKLPFLPVNMSLQISPPHSPTSPAKGRNKHVKLWSL